MNARLLFLLALLPILAPAAGTAMVRVTNFGPVPMTMAGQRIDPSGLVSLATTPAPIYIWLLLALGGAVLVLLVLIAVFRSKGNLCPHCGKQLVNGLCMNDECPAGLPVPPLPEPVSDVVSSPPPPADPVETCPWCGSTLVDGICPVSCDPPPRCPVCDTFLKDGVCPNGCVLRALNLGWFGSEKPALSPWRLEVVAPARFAGEACDLPFEVVIGRSMSEKKTTEAYIQLHFEDRRKANCCSRRYVRLVCDPATGEETVELLAASGRAVVAGETLSAPGDRAVLPEGGILDLPSAGYRLQLVRGDAEESTR